MGDPVLPEPAHAPTPTQGGLPGVLLAITERLRKTDPVDAASGVLGILDAHERYLDGTWPSSHPSDPASEVRDRALRMREKAVRSQLRIAAASGWAGVAVKISGVAASAGLLWRVFGG